MGASLGTVLECAKRDREPEDGLPPETAAITPLLQEQNRARKQSESKESVSDPEKAERRLMQALHRMQTLQKQLGAIGLYFLVGYIFYSSKSGWGFVKCIYFSVEVITSVGYGDILPPASDGALLFTCGYILCGIFIVAMVMAQIFDSVLSGAVVQAMSELDRVRDESIKNMFTEEEDDAEIFQQDAQATAGGPRWFKCPDLRVFKYLCASIVCLSVGMLGYAGLDAMGMMTESRLDHLNPWVRAFYFSVVTLTTVGFGDAFPTTPWSMLFCSLFMIMGIPIFGLGLAKFASHLAEDLSNAPASVVQINKLDKSKLASLVDFEGELHKACQLGQRDGYVDACEYMAFILVRNGVVSMDTVKDIIEGFNKLDRDGNGTINVHDLE